MWNMSTGRQKEKQICMECENRATEEHKIT